MDTQKDKDFETSEDQQESIIDQFISNGGFDKTFQDAFGLPESVQQSLKEVS